MKSKSKLSLQILTGILIGAGISLFLALREFTPVGNDIFGHLYKAEILYDNLKAGNFYPLYTTEWYNGIQLFRYWPIFTYYILALIQFLTKDVVLAYYVFAGLTFFISYLGFVMIGRREGKSFFVVLGVLYWFLPDNLRVFFGEGNLSRVMIYAMLPLFFYFYTNLLEQKKHFLVTAAFVAVITATHFMLAAMCAIIFVIYGFFKGMKNHTQFYGFFAFVSGIVMAGILLLPGLSGGLVSDSSSATVNTIEDWSQSLYLSLSPFNRMGTNCSFGIGALLMGVLGFWVAGKEKKERSGILVGLVFFALSDSVFTTVFKQLPLSQVFWMTRFAQMCYMLILYDFGRLEWAPYKKYAVVCIAVLDILPSLPFFTLTGDINAQEETYLLKQASALTENRMGLVDESTFGSYPAYYALKSQTPYTEGWAIQGAATSENIISMTESLQRGYYGYAFHQLLQLGSDTAVIKKAFVEDADELMQVAGDYGYVLVGESNEAYLFDLEGVNGNFGVKSSFNSLAIGDSSVYLSYLYPGFRRGDSDYLTDYTLEELMQYEKIYLSNFKYDDLSEAEQIIKKLSDNGVKVYIDCTHMPINVLSISEFLGVESRFVSLVDLDTLWYGERRVDVNLPYEWYATYLVPTDDMEMEEYTYQYGTQSLDYLIRKGNITFVGFNLVYMYFEKPNGDLLAMLDEVFEIQEADRRVQEKIVPIRVQYDRNQIVIETPERVNTTLAFQDNFQSDRPIAGENHMLVVEQGTTTIRLIYKHFLAGIMCSLLGCILSGLVYLKIRPGREVEK